jgi:hypothetical protein
MTGYPVEPVLNIVNELRQDLLVHIVRIKRILEDQRAICSTGDPVTGLNRLSGLESARTPMTAESQNGARKP